MLLRGCIATTLTSVTSLTSLISLISLNLLNFLFFPCSLCFLSVLSPRLAREDFREVSGRQQGRYNGSVVAKLFDFSHSHLLSTIYSLSRPYSSCRPCHPERSEGSQCLNGRYKCLLPSRFLNCTSWLRLADIK